MEAGPLSLLPARIGAEWICVSASLVLEVLGGLPWTPLPRSSHLVPGVVSWRGRAVPVVDLSAALDGPPSLIRGAQRPRTLVLEGNGSVLAIPVDGVREVQEVAPTELHAPRAATLLRLALVAAAEADLMGTRAAVLDVPALVARVHNAHAQVGDGGRPA